MKKTILKIVRTKISIITILITILLLSGCSSSLKGIPNRSNPKAYSNLLQGIHHSIESGEFLVAIYNYEKLLAIQENPKYQAFVNVVILKLLAGDIEGYYSEVAKLQDFDNEPIVKFHLSFAKYLRSGLLDKGFSDAQRKFFRSRTNDDQKIVLAWIKYIRGESSMIGFSNALSDYRGILPNPKYKSINGFPMAIIDKCLGYPYFQINL